MIRAQQLTKIYRDRPVVDDVSFEIEENEIVGFLGLNGAGKTTVLRMLAGLLAPSSGRILIDGHDLLEDPRNLRWQIGFLPETPPLYDEMLVEAFLRFAAQLRGYAVTDARLDEVLELTDLSSVRDERVRVLSHGYRQRLGIAQAIVHRPRLVILDEPINGLDPVQIVEMRALIQELRRAHTVLVSSHILTEISQTCDRMMILMAGRLVAHGSESSLVDQVSGRVDAVRATLLGDEAALRSALGTGVVRAFELQNIDAETYDVTAQLSTPEPEAFAAQMIAAGVGLRRLDTVKSELEALFVKLSGGDPS